MKRQQVKAHVYTTNKQKKSVQGERGDGTNWGVGKKKKQKNKKKHKKKKIHKQIKERIEQETR